LDNKIFGTIQAPPYSEPEQWIQGPIVIVKRPSMDVNDHALSQQGEEQSIKSPQGNDEAVRPANENCTVE
jgi:hypothetical protein